jgi:hypothetical protein
MQAIRSTLLALASAAAFSAPAHAQDQSWETQFLLIAQPCFESTASNKLQVCQTANSQLLAKAASYVGPMPKHEDNVYRAMRGIIFSMIGGEMGRLDGVRSRRSCEAIESAWTDVAMIDTSYSPERAADMKSIRDDTLKAIRLCRSEFGKMPTWAPDLPAY